MTEYTYFIMYHPNIKLNIFYGSFKTIHSLVQNLPEHLRFSLGPKLGGYVHLPF